MIWRMLSVGPSQPLGILSSMALVVQLRRCDSGSPNALAGYMCSLLQFTSTWLLTSCRLARGCTHLVSHQGELGRSA
eukprot:6484483-Amphidinium_carterae.2